MDSDQPGWLRGRLVSTHFARTVLPSLPGAGPPPPDVTRDLERLGEAAGETLGPTWSARGITDALLLPLLRTLELRVRQRRDGPSGTHLEVAGSGPRVVPVIVRSWTESLDLAWRDHVRDGIRADARWVISLNGREMRIVDTTRTWVPHYLAFDVAALAHDADLRRVLWTLARDKALTSDPALIDTAARLSAEFGTQVCRSLGSGVGGALNLLFDALRGKDTADPNELLHQCLTVIYRILFLLFAEARGLVPAWHPVYRDRYTVDTIVSTLAAGRPCRDLWGAIRAISRMAHAGCRAGTLSVTAFNGRLFAPTQTAALDKRRIDDGVMRRVVLGLSTTQSRATGMVRTQFAELDVEQLGSIYEHVLEHQPNSHGSSLVRTRDVRKASGTFYTPREVAAALVERTLDPLVRGRSAAEILDLRILDPAAGSGAFLVAACRYLARRVEEALVGEGTWNPDDVDEADRTSLRRLIVQRCLYGVDINPVAVQLARLSLWLVALLHDKPLSFLDHHLVVGNSLVGASPSDLHRSSGGSRISRRESNSPSLFGDEGLAAATASAVLTRTKIAHEPDDSTEQVRAKERALGELQRRDSALGNWQSALDLWCATWFWKDGHPPARGTVLEVASHLLEGRSVLARQALNDILRQSDECAEAMRFLHWPLAFPEIFQDAGGRPSSRAGFDAIVSNPPWDMVRADTGDVAARDASRAEGQRLTRFLRDAGIYRATAQGHVNRYAAFAERAAQLVKPGGRIGLVLPSGILSDAGAASLRRQLLSRTSIDSIVGFDNRSGIFPVHRSVRFVLITSTAGTETRSIRCRFGVTRPSELDAAESGALTFSLSRPLLDRISGEDLCIPEIPSGAALRLIESITSSIPPLGAKDGWNVRFGRELNATDDRHLMAPAASHLEGAPILEGKLLKPFRVVLADCRFVLAPQAARPQGVPRRPRLGYREVAAAGNRLTLIAAMVPAEALTLHTVFCLKSDLPVASQQVLCALLNSFVANYLVRLRVGTHVTAAVMASLRVPIVPRSSDAFRRLHRGSRVLSSAPDAEGHPAYTELQVLAARLYGLTRDDFALVLSTFPLIPERTRTACLEAFEAA